jgi:hypothetical protein
MERDFLRYCLAQLTRLIATLLELRGFNTDISHPTRTAHEQVVCLDILWTVAGYARIH